MLQSPAFTTSAPDAVCWWSGDRLPEGGVVCYIPTAKRKGGKGVGQFRDHNSALAWLLSDKCTVPPARAQAYAALLTQRQPGLAAATRADYTRVIIPDYTRPVAPTPVVVPPATDTRSRSAFVARIRPLSGVEQMAVDPEDLGELFRRYPGGRLPAHYCPCQLSSNGITVYFGAMCDPETVSHYKRQWLSLRRETTKESVMGGPRGAVPLGDLKRSRLTSTSAHSQ